MFIYGRPVIRPRHPNANPQRKLNTHSVNLASLENVNLTSLEKGRRSARMNTEREKMLAGELYDALHPELVQERNRARDLCQLLNATREAERELRRELLLKIFGKGGDTVWLQPPFFCDYGSNIELGERVFFNFNCTVL